MWNEWVALMPHSGCWIEVQFLDQDVNTHNEYKPTKGLFKLLPIDVSTQSVADKNTCDGQTGYDAQQRPIHLVLRQISGKTDEGFGCDN